MEDWDALTEADRGRFALVATDVLRSFESVHNQYKMGMLDQGAWDGWLTFYVDYCTAPGVRRYWALRKDTFSPGFRDVVDSLQPRGGGLRLEDLVTQD